MKPIFADPTSRWVPFVVAAATIVVGVWFAGVWQNVAFATTTEFAIGLAVVLIFLQGRLFW